MASNGGRLSIAALVFSAVGFMGWVTDEGYQEKAAPPVPGDVDTNGYGSTLGDDGKPLKHGETVDPVRAVRRAVRDIEAKEQVLKACFGPTVTLYQYEWDTYVRLSGNVGEHRVCNSSIPGKLQAGEYEAACRTILDFNKFRDRTKPKVKNPKTGAYEYPLVELRGLTLRRQREYRQCMGDSQ